MNHSFDIDIAKKYGVEAAIIIENLKFWIDKNRANNKHFYEGQYWTYNSAKAFSELFPYWSEFQISRILKKLEKDEVLLTGNFNQSSYDRTKWYSLNRKIHFTELQNGNDEIVKSYTDINTVVITDVITDEHKTSPTTKKTKPIPIREYLDLCRKKQISALPSDCAGLKSMDALGIPEKWQMLAWHEFKERHLENNKKQSNWVSTFNTYIKQDWLKLWAINKDNELYLTQSGKTCMALFEQKIKEDNNG